jgi:hypothetical protein
MAKSFTQILGNDVLGKAIIHTKNIKYIKINPIKGIHITY